MSNNNLKDLQNSEKYEVYSQEEFLNKLLDKVIKIKKLLSFRNPEDYFSEEISMKYENMSGIELVTEIEKGDISPYILDELVNRLINEKIEIKVLKEFLPHYHDGSLDSLALKFIIRNIIRERINNAGLFSGVIGMGGKGITYKYPSRDKFKNIINELIKDEVIEVEDLFYIARDRSVEALIKEAIGENIEEDVKETSAKVKDDVLKNETSKYSKVFDAERITLRMPKKVEVSEQENQAEQIENQIENQEEQKEEQENNTNVTTEQNMEFNKVIENQAEQIENQIEDQKEEQENQENQADQIENQAEQIAEQIENQIEDQKEEQAEQKEEQENNTNVTTEQNTEENEEQNMEFNKVIENQEQAVVIDTENILENTKEKVETAKTEKMSSYRPEARMITPEPLKQQEFNEPEATEVVSAPKIENHTLIQSKKIDYKVKAHSEKPDCFILPTVSLIKNNQLISVQEILGSVKMDNEGYFLYVLGSDKDECDILIGEDKSINKKHLTIRIKDENVQIKAENGITKIRGKKGTVTSWEDITPNTEIEIGNRKIKTSILINQKQEVTKEEFKNIFIKQIYSITDKQLKLVESFLDEGEEWENLNLKLNELEFIDISLKITGNDSDFYRELREKTLEPRKIFEQRKREELEIRKKLEIEKAIKEKAKETEIKRVERELKEKVEKRCKEEGCQALHLEAGEDPEIAKIVWRGWVLEIKDEENLHGNPIRPMLISSRTFGSHHACTDELINPERETIKKKYLVKEFMAEISPHLHKSDVLLVQLLGGQVQKMDSDGFFRTPVSSTIELREGEIIRVGRYNIKVLGNDHAFSEKAILPYAKEMVDQAIERIFEAERTTAQGDLKDHLDIEKLTRLNLPNSIELYGGNKISLKEYASNLYKEEFLKIWESLNKWTPEKPNFDAMHFPTLQMLIDQVGEIDSFVPDFGVTQENLTSLAEKRVERYLEAGKNVYPNYSYHPLNGFNQLKKLVSRILSEKTKEQENNEKTIADLGLIEIAKFITELDYFKLEEIGKKASDTYYQKLINNIHIRRVLTILENKDGEINKLELIERLRGLCYEKKMGEVFTEDEIAIKSLSLGIQLNENSIIDSSLISKLALGVASDEYEIVKELEQKFNPQKDDPTKLKKHLEILIEIIKMNLFNEMNLNKDLTNIKNNEEINKEITEINKKVKIAEKRLSFIKQEEQKNIEDKQEYQELVYKKQIEYLNAIQEIRLTLLSVNDVSIEQFKKMDSLIDYYFNKDLDAYAERSDLKIEGIVLKASDEDNSSLFDDKKEVTIKTETVIERWADVKRNFWIEYKGLAEKLTKKIIDGDENAEEIFHLLLTTIKNRHLGNDFLGYEIKQIQNIIKDNKKTFEKQQEHKKQQKQSKISKKNIEEKVKISEENKMDKEEKSNEDANTNLDADIQSKEIKSNRKMKSILALTTLIGAVSVVYVAKYADELGTIFETSVSDKKGLKKSKNMGSIEKSTKESELNIKCLSYMGALHDCKLPSGCTAGTISSPARLKVKCKDVSYTDKNPMSEYPINQNVNVKLYK